MRNESILKKEGSYILNYGVQIPAVGFGTYKAAEGRNADVSRMAIESGYRYFDTASFYGTETYLAEAVRESGLHRDDFFIASKLWKTEMGYETVKTAFTRTLEKLETDYLDLYLIHWPLPEPEYADWRNLDRETWRAMEELCAEGKIRAIGLSNFLPHHIDNILKDCKIRPVVNQIEYHPGYSQEAVVSYCKDQNILVEAWSPMGRRRVLDEPLVQKLSGKYGVSPAQICLKFAVQRGIIPLPKSSTVERMRENLDLFSFEMEQEDIWRLATMPQTGWSGEHPDRERVRI